VENCELNGKDIYQNGLLDSYPASHDNAYRDNVVHNFLDRGIWSMRATDNIVIEGNTVHDVQYGIDCDGAAVPVTHCNVMNNYVYNSGRNAWGAGIFLEDCFGCLVQGNTLGNMQNGVGIFAINYGNGSPANWHTYYNVEYRDDASNTSILDNVMYNYDTGSGIYVSSVNGLVIDHNTFYTALGAPPIGFHADVDGAGLVYPPRDETITNNIFFSGDVAWYNMTTTGLIEDGNFKGDPSFVDPPADLRLLQSSPACVGGVGGTYAGASPCE
jgi:hypothetical protein